MTEKEILEKAKDIVFGYGLSAEILEGAYSVGVGGDERTYMPVINIIGKFPGYEKLSKISDEITNTLNVNKVVFQLSGKK